MTVVSLYISVNWVKSTCSGHIYHNFSCCDDLSKFGKEYLKSLKCEFCTFFSIKLRKFWHTARLSRTNRHKVIKSENSPGFLAHPVCIHIHGHLGLTGCRNSELSLLAMSKQWPFLSIQTVHRRHDIQCLILGINIKDCSLSKILTAMDQKLQKSLEGDITHHQFAWKSTWCWVLSPFNDFCSL